MVSKPLDKTRAPIRLANPAFDADEIQAVVAVLQSGYLVQGPKVREFEAAVAKEVDSQFAVACSSGTAALHLAMMAAGLGPGDRVIVPSYTFPATANMVEICGAEVDIVDVDPSTFNIDIAHAKTAIGPQTKAIIGVDLFGLCADWAALSALAEENGLMLIADAACALGASYPNAHGEIMPAGKAAAMATWSFHPRKVITTGEGGMVTTDDPALYAKLCSLRNHGVTTGENGPEYAQIGPNYRLTNFQGALGVGQMERLQGFITRRRQLAARYDQGLASMPAITAPRAQAGYTHIYQAYITLLDEGVDRQALLADLRSRQIEASIGTYALHTQPYYREKYQLNRQDFPGANRVNAQALALPLHPKMTEEDVDYVVEVLGALLAS